MESNELIAETNPLLKKFFDLQQQQEAKSEEARLRFVKHQEDLKAKMEVRIRERLAENGVQADQIEGVLAKVRESENPFASLSEPIEDLRALERAHQERIFAELKRQGDLLVRIAEALEK